MAYLPTTTLGQKLPDPSTVQAFETLQVNANAMALEDAILADRDRLGTGTVEEQIVAGLDARGFIRYATRALMNVNTTAAFGTHATVYADPTPVLNGDYSWSGLAWIPALVPFAMAAGVVDVSEAGTDVVFPAGRFNQPPIVTLGPGHVSASGAKGNPVIIKYNTRTATGVTLLSTAATIVSCCWVAIQMTPSAAGG